MRLGLVFSILLHAALLAFAIITIERSMPFLPDQQDIPVEVVTVADAANVKAATKETKPEEQPPAPAPEVAPPPQAAAPPEPEPAPEAAPPEPAPKADEPKPAPKTAEVRPQARPTPKKDAKKEDKFDLDAISVLINKEQKAQEREQKTAEEMPSETADKPRESVGAGDDMTITLVQLMQRQIGACWSFPAGAVQPEELAVGVTIFLREDGTLAEPPRIDDQGRMSEPYFRAAAEAAIRAINRCQPYELPTEQYDVWKEIDLTFDPRKMIGL